ncbi:adenylate kinase [Quillaja saponaria]|uniref:adenylate kinase n=1 Tax=Quillaja saponaria TaxID=32244 RepID=A0AAD7Q4T2_QUISA|nr:adenylate kinase [Quillaja saponaria]
MAGISRVRVISQPLRAIRSLGLLPKRAYGAAAAVQYDYDDYEEELELYRRDQNRRSTMVDSEGWEPERGVQWVMIGEPGAKRHVYAERLSKLLEVPHICMGTLVRQELNPRSTLYQQIANAINEGKLVPEEIIFGLLSKRLEEGYSRGETGFILDGIPRTRIQAEILDQIAHVDLVVNFKWTEDNLVKEKLKIGHISPHHECLSMSSARCNLNQQLQEKKLESPNADAGVSWNENALVYAEQIKQLEDYYKKQKKLLDFEVTGAPGETWQGLLAALHLQHINAVNSAAKLTA